MFSADLYGKALTFAARAHGAQLTPHGLPYVVHLSGVCMEVTRALREEPGRDEDLAVACALLHDVVEDTATRIDEVEKAFGPRVAAGVGALTKDAGVEKPRRMEDSLQRILRQPAEVAMVKLADRITNLGPPPPTWSREKKVGYRAEAQLILERLGAASGFLTSRLEARIDAYPVD
ncbi:MAG: HD domain-containing protein [Myxococcaceae bacterium]|nr:HD domain-containing protein [Myxococcaceae bacterium]